jgi:hypothetical protein
MVMGSGKKWMSTSSHIFGVVTGLWRTPLIICDQLQEGKQVRRGLREIATVISLKPHLLGFRFRYHHYTHIIDHTNHQAAPNNMQATSDRRYECP